MAQTLWDVFISLFSRGSDGGEETDDGDNRFVPSPLDLSIRFSHGGSDVEIDRELNKINKQARELESQRRDE
jgi:hypothetical protein